MTPNIIDRVDTLIQAMIEVVMPAIQPTEHLAIDQAGLVVAHLTMIRAQLPMAEAFEQVELDSVTALGCDLLGVAAGGPETVGARNHLKALIDGRDIDPSATREERWLQLNAAVDKLVRTSRVDGDPGVAAQIAAKVIAVAKQTSWRDRVWFSGSGFDADQKSLPDRSTIFG